MALEAIDRIISEVNELDEKDRIILFKRIGQMFSITDETSEEDESLQAVFGLWKDYDIDKATLRKKAWREN